MSRPEAIAIGCSQGGLNALRVVLGGLGSGLQQSVLVCCHTSGDVATMCALLGSHCALPVVEARERMPVRGSTVYVAPGGYHLLIENDCHFALSVDAPVRHSRPSIDVMFSSASDVYRSAIIGVVLTGANHDGAEGLAEIRRRGGIAIVQEPETAEVSVMPRAALELAGADYCLPLERIAATLNQLCLA